MKHAKRSNLDRALRILMVEDSITYARLVTAQLGASFPVPHTLAHCDSLELALSELDARTHELIILDLELPDSSGLATFRAIHQAAPDTPIVILSGDNSEDKVIEAVREGADDYLVKGSNDRVALIRSLRLALERRRRLIAERELGAARVIQQALLPHGNPQIEGFDMAGAMYPAVETAGDYYDFIMPLPTEGDGREVGIVVADVSGHGCGPAMLMAETRGCIHAFARAEANPAKILRQTHAVLGTDRHSHFVTMFLGCLDCETRSLTYSGAGHEGYLLHAHGPSEQLLPSGMPLGVEDCQWPAVGPIQLHGGDVLIVTTDGFAEAMNPEEQQFGRERLLSFFEQQRHEPAAEIIHQLMNRIESFTQGAIQQDDMAIVVVKVEHEPAGR